MRNCCLCVLSQYCPSQGCHLDQNLSLCEGTFEFIDALHLSGATTLLCPLFTAMNGSDKLPRSPQADSQSPISGLVSLSPLFLLNMYTLLPSMKDIAVACQKTQLWFKDIFTKDILELFVKDNTLLHIPDDARQTIISQVELYLMFKSKASPSARPNDTIVAPVSAMAGGGPMPPRTRVFRSRS